MDYCPHCMSPIQGGGRFCPDCGGDLTWKGQTGIDLPVGTVLTGGNGLRSFLVGAARGKGGFGITYIAVETHSHRRVAIKEYFPTRCAFRAGNGVSVQAMTSQDDAFRGGMKSFLEEARMLLAQEDLPTVVKVIDYFQANGTAYLAMEYLDGVPLHTKMQQFGGRIPADQLLPRMERLIRDMGQLHQRGVIHRDVSPDNIMWMPDGGLKLLDFGSARSTEDGKSMTVLLKQGFSPIEQYRSRGQGPFTDVYALSATIYYCLTGVIPPSAVERLDEDPLQPPNALGAGLSARQEEALLWGLAVQPRDRPQTMDEFAARLYQPEAAPVPPAGPAPAENPIPPTGPAPEPPKPEPRPAPRPEPGPASRDQSAPDRPVDAADQRSKTGAAAETAPDPSQPTQDDGTPLSRLIDMAKERTAGSEPRQEDEGSPFTRLIDELRWKYFGGVDRKPLIIGGAIAAAIVMFLIALLAGLTPIGKTGTSNDFTYIIEDDEAVITGYEGTDSTVRVPDKIQVFLRSYPVTCILTMSGAGRRDIEGLVLPDSCEEIVGQAFRSCANLTWVEGPSSMEVHNQSSCDKLMFIYTRDGAPKGKWTNLSETVKRFYYGMPLDNGASLMERPEVSDSGVAYYDGLMLDEETTVILDVLPKEGETEVDLTGFSTRFLWVNAGALDRFGDAAPAVTLPDNAAYNGWELYADWYANSGSFADMWILDCDLAASLNGACRDWDTGYIVPDLALIRAAAVRAEELLELYDAGRPDGSTSWDLLHEMDIDYQYAGSVYAHNYDDRDEIAADGFDYILENYGGPLSSEDSASLAGEYYDRLGLAWAEESDGELSWFFYAVVD